MLDALNECAGLCPLWVYRRVVPLGCWRIDRFFRMYLSSVADTAQREVDDRDVGTILFTPIRPEFRGPVRRCCYALAAFASLPIRVTGRPRVSSPPRAPRIGKSSSRCAGMHCCSLLLPGIRLSLTHIVRWPPLHALATNRSRSPGSLSSSMRTSARLERTHGSSGLLQPQL